MKSTQVSKGSKNPKTIAKKLEKQKRSGYLAWDAKRGPYKRDRDGDI